MDLRSLGKDQYTSNGNDIFKPNEQIAIVDARITEKEDANLKEYQELPIGELTLGDSDLPNRPEFGKNGESVILRANVFELRLEDGRQFFTYRVDVDQRLRDSKHKRRDFLQTILQRLPELKALGPGVVTDYESLLVTSAKIDLGPTNQKTYAIPYYDRGFPEGQVGAGEINFTFTLSLLKPISSADLSRYVESSPATIRESQSANAEVTCALNAVIAGHPNKERGVYHGGQNKFFRYPSDRGSASNYDLQGGLIAVRGYWYHVRFATLRIILNIHGTCNPFYKEINARELMQEFEDLNGKQQNLNGFFHKLRVKTSYTKGPNHTTITKFKTVTGVSSGSADETRFKPNPSLSEASVSITQYFSTEYGLNLKYPGKRVLNCGTTIRPVWIPAELCTVMPGQHYAGELLGSQTTRMLIIAARPPAENARRIVGADGGLGLIGVVPERCPTLVAFGITVHSDMAVPPGRLLSCPRLKYGGTTVIPKGGTWNMSGKKFSKPALMPPWTLLRIGAATSIDHSSLASQVKTLTDVFGKYGLKMVKAKEFPGPSLDLPQSAADGSITAKRMMDEALETLFKDYEEKGIRMFVVILPSDNSWLYARVKYWGDVKYGIHTTCVQMSMLQKANVNISANISLKVNIKLGGTNQCLYPKALGFLELGNTMVVGIDVTHPEPGSVKGTPSIAGIVASINSDFTQWPGDIRRQESRTEMVSELDLLMKERLRLWVSKNPRRKLENIIVYRDGVSDSQFETVLQKEIPAIRSACSMVLDDSPQPKITCIVAVKRHHNRFYPTDKDGADPKHNNNINTGTTVDRNVTIPQKWDFFMAPHRALQGTTIPAHYVVILDESKDSNKLGADLLEQITHSLCYLHGTTTSAISICPPAYYADKICERARCYLADYIATQKLAGREYEHNDAPWVQGVHEQIKDSMFYV